MTAQDSTLTQALLKDLLHYAPKTGSFTWKANRAGRAVAGSIAGSIYGHGYRCIRLYGKRYQAHRLVWLYVYGEFPAKGMDHINHNRDDNRLCNLRVVSHIENMQNQSLDKRNKSGISGVTWDKRCRKWQVNITVNFKQMHLGRFSSLEEAKTVRKYSEVKYGYHENHGK